MFLSIPPVGAVKSRGATRAAFQIDQPIELTKSLG
jgi:hypothetical protein